MRKTQKQPFSVNSPFLLLLAIPLLSISCGQPSLLPVTISGVAQAGRVAGAKVTVYKVSNSNRGEIIGESETDNDGNYKVKIAPQSGPVEVVVSSGKYTDEATGEEVEMSDTDELSAVLEDAASEKSSVPVTPLTTIIRERVMAQLEANNITVNQFSSAKNAATEEVAQMFGVNKATITSIPGKPENPGNPSTDEAKAAFLLATFSQYLKDKNLSPDKGVNPSDVLKAIASDFKNDGKLDAKDNGTPIETSYQVVSNGWANGMDSAATNFRSSQRGSAFIDFDKAKTGMGDFKSEPENRMQEVARNGQTQVVICHVPPGFADNSKTLTISEAAVAAHLAHGDYRGECTATPTPTPNCDSDIVQPTLTGFSLSPGSVDVSAAAKNITATISISDLCSLPSNGQLNVEARFVAPTTGQFIDFAGYTGSEEAGGTNTARTFIITSTLPQASEAGTWTLSYVRVRDNVGNIKSYSASNLVSLGFTSEFQNTASSFDPDAPVITQVTITALDSNGSPIQGGITNGGSVRIKLYVDSNSPVNWVNTTWNSPETNLIGGGNGTFYSTLGNCNGLIMSTFCEVSSGKWTWFQDYTISSWQPSGTYTWLYTVKNTAEKTSNQKSATIDASNSDAGNTAVSIHSASLVTSNLDSAATTTVSLHVVAQSIPPVNWLTIVLNGPSNNIQGGGSGVSFSSCADFGAQAGHPCEGLGANYWYHSRTFTFTQWAENGTYTFSTVNVANAANITSSNANQLSFVVSNHLVANTPVISSIVLKSYTSGQDPLTEGTIINGTCLEASAVSDPLRLALVVTSSSNAPITWFNSTFTGPTAALSGGGYGLTSTDLGGESWRFVSTFSVADPTNAPKGTYAFTNLSVGNEGQKTSNSWGGSLSFQLKTNCLQNFH